MSTASTLLRILSNSASVLLLPISPNKLAVFLIDSKAKYTAPKVSSNGAAAVIIEVIANTALMANVPTKANAPVSTP